MNQVIPNMYHSVKRKEIEILIKNSGSTRNSGNEKIRSGQSYLYKKNGMESEVIEIRLDKKVSGSFLNQALLSAGKRYPYMNTKLIEKDGNFYIVQNGCSMVAKRAKSLAKLGHISCGYHLVDITYDQCSIFVSFHHALCDGCGIKPFIETLIYYYCYIKYGMKKTVKGIRLAGEPLLEGETEDPFLKKYEYNTRRKLIEISRDAFVLPLINVTKEETNYRYEVKIPHSSFMRVCRENNATPVILLSLLMSRGIAELYPKYDKPIYANIATDMREVLRVPNTYKNCVKSGILPYTIELANRSLQEQSSEYRELLKQQRDPDYCKKEANTMIDLFNKLDTRNSYDEKQKIMTFFEDMTLHTYVVSYLGQFLLGANAQYIDSIHLYNSGTTGLGINMISSGDFFILDFKQHFSSNQYIKAFLRQLENFSIAYCVSEVISFSTPVDAIIKR